MSITVWNKVPSHYHAVKLQGEDEPVVTVLTCVSIAGGGGEGSPGRDEEEQEAQKNRNCCVCPVTFPESQR